MTNWQRFDKTT